MARFMDVHRGFKGMTREQLAEAHRKDQQLEAAEGVRFVKAWADPESGTAFCLSEGPSKEAVLRVHERAGHPTGEIYEVPIDIE
jgi:hypothetical protein